MHHWMRRGWFAWSLLPLSGVFCGLTGLRRWLYRAGLLRSTKMPVPVIVVGNIFIGGTGKTPLTMWLVAALRQAGYVPGVIMRGYGGNETLPRSVTAASLARDVGDEAVLIASRAQVAVVVGRDRVAAATTLLAQHPTVNVIISDDGLQHYALERDIEIVLFDGRGLGNGWCLPAGPLRESASRRGDFTVLNGAHWPAGFASDVVHMQLVGDHAYRLANHADCQALASFRHAELRILAAAGIGHPARFFALLRAAGLQFDTLALPDHDDFAHPPFATMVADIILITEKDAVKCRQIDALKQDPRIWVVPVSAQIDPALVEKVLSQLHR